MSTTDLALFLHGESSDGLDMRVSSYVWCVFLVASSMCPIFPACAGTFGPETFDSPDAEKVELVNAVIQMARRPDRMGRGETEAEMRLPEPSSTPAAPSPPPLLP